MTDFLVYGEYGDYGLPFQNFIVLDCIKAGTKEEAYKTFIKNYKKKSKNFDPNTVRIVPLSEF